MGGPREYHTKWSKSEKNKYYIITCMWNLKNNTIEFIYKTETGLKQNKNLWLTKGEREWGRDKSGVLETNYYT